MAIIVPWPHYAELVVGDRVGVRFKFPAGRTNVTPCEIVARWCDNDPLAVAQAFRDWRTSTKNLGAIPRPRSLLAKANDLPNYPTLDAHLAETQQKVRASFNRILGAA